MNRIYTTIGLILAILVAIFAVTSMLSGYLLVMLAVAVVFLAIGVFTGQ